MMIFQDLLSMQKHLGKDCVVCLFGVGAEGVEDEEAGQISRTLKKYQLL